MIRHDILSLTVLAALGLAVLPGIAFSQQQSLKDQLVEAKPLKIRDCPVSQRLTARDAAKPPLDCLYGDLMHIGQLLKTLLKCSHLDWTTHDQGSPLMNVMWLHIQEPLSAIARRAARLFREKRNRVGFVQETQPSFRVVCRRRIDEYASTQKRAMEIRHHRSNKSRRVAPAQTSRPQSFQIS